MNVYNDRCFFCGETSESYLTENENGNTICFTCEKENKPKTEDLNFQEACAAIGRGECVESQTDKSIFSGLGLWFARQQEWITKCTLPIMDTYRIVPDPSKQVEEKPSLTYEQALECEKVKIFIGSEEIMELKKHPLERWTFRDLLDFDIAERRGYKMEPVD